MFRMISAVYSHLTQMAKLNDDVTKIADILNQNGIRLCIILLLMRGHFQN